TGIFEIGDTTMNIWDALEVNESRLGQIFSLNKSRGEAIDNIAFNERTYKPYGGPVLESDPVALIVVMPGSNCEYDLERAFEKAGAKTNTFVLRNRNKEDLIWSSDELAKEIGKSQILVLPGGFSAGDEPDGSGKFIANVLRNEKIKAAVNDLTKVRDGLIIGICNGFQALIKTGLVPYGEIIEPKEDMPLLTNNKAGKHMDIIARVRIASVNSPWMKYVEVDEAYSVPISHGEGRFMASEKEMEKLLANGQVITQYCDMDDNATMDAPYNPNGSMNGVEGIVSPCGRILGKMGHNERWEDGLMRNYIDKFDMQIFKAGVDYFKKQ
ncbi:MAG: phosphoribosylformylglycinamidine synthase subunit PurQ, partial [Clostridiaceae bacterium]